MSERLNEHEWEGQRKREGNLQADSPLSAELEAGLKLRSREPEVMT